jgi:hypothetical protein
VHIIPTTTVDTLAIIEITLQDRQACYLSRSGTMEEKSVKGHVYHYGVLSEAISLRDS